MEGLYKAGRAEVSKDKEMEGAPERIKGERWRGAQRVTLYATVELVRSLRSFLAAHGESLSCWFRRKVREEIGEGGGEYSEEKGGDAGQCEGSEAKAEAGGEAEAQGGRSDKEGANKLSEEG